MQISRDQIGSSIFLLLFAAGIFGSSPTRANETDELNWITRSVSEKEIRSCQLTMRKALLWDNCQKNGARPSCVLAKNLYLDQPVPKDFLKEIETYRGGIKKWVKNFRAEVGDRFHEYPLKVTVSVVFTILDVAVARFAPAFFPAVHGVGWAVGLYMWGPEGFHLLNPCKNVAPDTPDDKLKRCAHELKKRIGKQTFSLNEDMMGEFFDKVRKSKNGLPFRYSCAILENRVATIEQHLDASGCDQGLMHIESLPFRIISKNELQHDTNFFHINVKNGVVSVKRRVFPYHNEINDFRQRPFWVEDLKQSVLYGWEFIQSETAKCLASNSSTRK